MASNLPKRTSANVSPNYKGNVVSGVNKPTVVRKPATPASATKTNYVRKPSGVK